MKGSSASEVLFISVNHSITLMGKVWLIVMIFLRVLILLFAGYPLYQDEQERFVCNTIQPGCANVCYDTFSPVSLFRFWLVQLITLCLPFIIFVIYVVHKVLITLSIALSSTGQRKTFQLFKVHQDLLKKICLNKIPLDVEQQQCFTGVYILQLLFRTLLEAGFGAANYYLFGFYIPSRFLCQHPPCTTQVDCYISRPTEKTVLLNFMFAMATLSLFLNFVDFFCAIKHSVRQKTKGKMMMETVFKDEQCFFSAEVASTEMDPNSTLAQQDLPTQPGETGSFRKRRGSKGSCGGGEFHSGQEETNLGCCSHPYSPGSICCNKGNNKYLISQEDVLERNGSEVALWPLEPMGTPGSIRINKRSKLKPPPPTRRDLRLPSRESAALVGDVSAASAVYARSFGQYTLVELSSAAEQGNEGEQERRSEWV